MLTILLDCTSHVTYCYGFVWCSMKSIRRVSLCNKTAPMEISLCVIINRMLHDIYQNSLQSTLCLISEKRKFGLYNSFPCQTIQGRTRHQKQSVTEILEYAPHNQNEKHLIPLPTNSYVFPFHTNICFLHACTPNACTGTPVQATNTRLGTGYKKTYPSKKTFKLLKRWATWQAVAQVNPTAQNT